MLEHMMNHHKVEYAAVTRVPANSKGQSLASFTVMRQ
jgi:acyl-coenzyme A synthetase/AMP-(fatty) acid ligase